MTVRMEGKVVAERIMEDLRRRAREEAERRNSVPGLAVILVGEDAASRIYVDRKRRSCDALGFYSEEHRLPADVSEEALLEKIVQLNTRPEIHGVLVQFPLPPHLDRMKAVSALSPQKDVDGIHPVNLGKLLTRDPGLLPCTPAGVMRLLGFYGFPVHGKHAVVVGRSLIVGRPMAQLLLKSNATVTVCHRHTVNLAHYVRQADILVVAVGKPGLIRGEWVKEGAVVVDVGINRLENGRITGDVQYEEAMKRAKAITPVPGGVGPMTIAMLMVNTFQAYLDQTRAAFEASGAKKG